jgi:hypothetical protein
MLRQAPYSSDLPPTDFRLFPILKARLLGIRFQISKEITMVQCLTKSSPKRIYQHRKYARVGGDYIDKTVTFDVKRDVTAPVALTCSRFTVIYSIFMFYKSMCSISLDL